MKKLVILYRQRDSYCDKLDTSQHIFEKLFAISCPKYIALFSTRLDTPHFDLSLILILKNPVFSCRVKIPLWRTSNFSQFHHGTIFMNTFSEVIKQLIHRGVNFSYVQIVFSSHLIKLLCWHICRQLPVFSKNFIRVPPIKLNIGILYHRNNTFWRTVFYIYYSCLETKYISDVTSKVISRNFLN